MRIVHPPAVTQEQILRTAFFGQLPRELRGSLGTVSSAVHPERPTPSNDYQNTGSRTMRARYDLGFGHPTQSANIVGAIELKADNRSSFSGVNPDSRFAGEEDNAAEAEEIASQSVIRKGRKEPLEVDFFKLLDPNLPEESFRISWIALGRRSRATPDEVCERAAQIVKAAAKKRQLSIQTWAVDHATDWLVFTFSHPNVRLELAWYQPQTGNPMTYDPVFRVE
jgi:hypothetical protein